MALACDFGLVSPGQPGYQARGLIAAAECEPVSPSDELNTSLLQFGTWNIQGKPLELALTALHDFRVDLHAIAFQEVGGSVKMIPNCPSMCLNVRDMSCS